ncbi:MAG: PAS-domain containing protein [Alphaproteobacteria bacterium]|nr:PAS-domain containing protein [Alphaproteobacteria bacterium]
MPTQAETQAALRQARDELEERVAARTRELSESNRALEAEMAERSRAEQALRQIFENAGVGLARARISDGEIITANQRCAEIFGYRSVEAFVAQSEVTNPLVRPGEREKILTAALETGVIRDHQTEIVRPDGSRGWVRLSITLLPKEDVFDTVVVDITAQHEAETRLGDSEQKYRAIFDNAQIGLARVRLNDSRILEANDRCAEIFGYDSPAEFAAEFITRDHYVDSGVRDQLLAMEDSLGRVRNAEAEITRRDGTPIWVRWSAVFSPDRQFTDNVLVDITEERRVRQQVEEKTALLEDTLENVTQAISVFDDQLRLVAWNSRFLELLELPPEYGKLGRPFADFIRLNAERGEYGPGDVETQVSERVEQVRKFEPHHFERVRPDGTVLEIIGAAMPGGGFATTYIDITERTRARQELQRSNRLLAGVQRAQDQFISDAEPEAIFGEMLEVLVAVTNSEFGFIGEIIYRPDGNPYIKAITATNLSLNEDTARFFSQNVPSELVFDKLDNLFGAVVTEGRAVIANDPANDPRAGGLPPGHPPVNAFLGIPFHKGHRLVGMAGMANRPGGYGEEFVEILRPLGVTASNLIDGWRNTLAHSEAAAALRESEERFSSIFNNAQVGMLRGRLDGVALEANERAAEILGYANRQDLIDNYNSERHWLNHGVRTHYVQEMRTKGWIRNYEHEVLRVDGSIGIINLSAVFYPDYYFDNVFIDVTDRKKAEVEMVAAKETAELADRAKSEFLANVSHELRTPLNAILGFTEMIRQEIVGPIGEPRYLDYASDVSSSGQHLLELINDILDLSKIESGEIELRESELEIMANVQWSLMLFGDRSIEAGVKLETDIPANIPGLWADQRMLRQMLTNLISNAIKFSHKGDLVTVAAAIRDDGSLLLSVADTGIGIAGADLPKALSTFGQIDGDLDRRYEGTGLGLPLVRMLSAAHGGGLEIDSEVGVGTTATIWFPADRVGKH